MTTTALAATEKTTACAPGPDNGGQRCIRRPGASWTSCRCTNCIPLTARVLKLHRAGYQVQPDAAAARRRIEEWLDQGWTGATIASAMGITPMAGRLLLGRHRAGRAMASSTVRRVLAAKEAQSGIIRAVGTMRRVQGLTWMGYGLENIAAETGVARSSITRARSGQSPTVSLATHKAVAEAYARLQNTPGPAPHAAAHARQKGYNPPAVWDDETIDDPAAEPQGTATSEKNSQLVDDLVLDEIRELHRIGWSDTRIGLRVGRTPGAVFKLRQRNGIRRAS